MPSEVFGRKIKITMETQGHFGTPRALCRREGAARPASHRRTSTLAPAFAFVLFVAFFATPAARAQKQWPGSGSPYPSLPQSNFPQHNQTAIPGEVPPGLNDPLDASGSPLGMIQLMPVDTSRLINDESCQSWTAAAVNSPTVSVARLAVPGGASHEFQKACSEFKSNKLESAEGHARKAVKIYPDYAAGWVLLGQILHANHKDKEAMDACHNGEHVDPTYAPPYICLAGFAARADDWDEAYSLSNHALSLDPATDPYAYLYTATADFHLKRMGQAELYALSAEKLDKWNHIPEVHLLLANLYDAKGDRVTEAAELRKFLKDSPHNSDWEAVKTRLSAIETHDPAK